MADSTVDFPALIRRHGDKIYNVAYRLAGNEADAEELVQEALTRTFRHWHKYDPGRPFDAWVIQILKNLYLDEVRRYGHKHTLSMDAPTPADAEVPWSEMLAGTDPDPLAHLIGEERDSLIQKSLDALPVDYRAAVTLCDIEQMSYEEISRVMDCPLGTVRSRIHQGRQLLRKAFDRFQKKGGGRHVGPYRS